MGSRLRQGIYCILLVSCGSTSGSTDAKPDGGTAGVAGAGGASSLGPSGEVTVSLAFSADDSPEATSSLSISNETLIFPLRPAPQEQLLSRSNPGDLIIAYTRVGCDVEPEAWIGPMGHGAVSVPGTEPGMLTRVTIEFDLTGPGANEHWAEDTCVTVRPPEGAWQPFLQPTEVTGTATTLHLEFTVPGTVADAAAVFLPTYTLVSQITYTLVP